MTAHFTHLQKNFNTAFTIFQGKFYNSINFITFDKVADSNLLSFTYARRPADVLKVI